MNPEYQQAIEKPVEYIDSIYQELNAFVSRLHTYAPETTDMRLLMGMLTISSTLQQQLSVLRYSIVHNTEQHNTERHNPECDIIPNPT